MVCIEEENLHIFWMTSGNSKKFLGNMTYDKTYNISQKSWASPSPYKLPFQRNHREG